MVSRARVLVGAIVLGAVLVGCSADEPEAPAAAAPSVAAVQPSPTPTPAPSPSAAPSASAEPAPAPSTEPVAPAPAPAPPPPADPPEPAEEVLSRDDAEAVLIDTVAEELGVPRFLVSRYIAANGGLEAVARDNGVSEDDIARLNAGVTRSELDAALGPLVDQIEQRLAER